MVLKKVDHPDSLVLYSDLHFHDDNRFQACQEATVFVKTLCRQLYNKGYKPRPLFLGDVAEGHVVRGRRTYSKKIINACYDAFGGFVGGFEPRIVSGNHDFILPEWYLAPDFFLVGNIGVCTVPFMRRDDMLKTFDTLVERPENMCGNEWEKAKYRILIGHFGVVGAEVGNGVDWVGDISVDELPVEELDLDLIVLGHYHTPQTVHIPGSKCKIMYCGAMVPLGHEIHETDEPRGPILIRVDNGGKLVTTRIPFESTYTPFRKRKAGGKVVEGVREKRSDRAESLTCSGTMEDMVLKYLEQTEFECTELTRDVVEASFSGLDTAERWD